MLVIIYNPITRRPHPRAIFCVTSVGTPSTAAVLTKVSSSGRHIDLQFGTYPHNLSSYEPSGRLLIGGRGRDLYNLCANAPRAAQLTLFCIKYSRNGEDVDETGKNRIEGEEERGVVDKTGGGQGSKTLIKSRLHVSVSADSQVIGIFYFHLLVIAVMV